MNPTRTPPPLMWLSLLLSASCGDLDTVNKIACDFPEDCNEGFACVNRSCEPGSMSDSDGDGIFDTDELAGYEIIVDEQGFGLAVGSDLVTRRQVTSNPQNPDTDGDGLTDREELTERSDPRRADTDGDGISDLEEKRRWQSNLLSVDSDGDSRDMAGTSVPLPALFDGAELMAGTSPTLADTDGDGKTDLEERDVSNRDPRVAQIPQADMQTEGALTVQMNVTYTDETTTEVTYGEEFSTTDTTRRSRSDMESTAITIAGSNGGEGFFDDLEFSKEGAIKFFGGQALELGRQGVCQLVGNGGVVFDKEEPNLIEDAINFLGGLAADIFEGANLGGTGVCDPPTPETTNTTSTTLTTESERSATETYSTYRTESQTRTETAANGIVTVGFRIRNTGISTFDLVNPSVTMMQWTSAPNAGASVGSGAFRTLATLRAIDGGQLDGNGNRTFTLGPNQDALIQMENREVNADFVKGFLARPQAIFFSPAQFALSDREGVDFEFLTEETFARTATLVIDDGRGPVRRWQVATNVDKTDTGDFAGVRLGEVLSEMLEIPFTTRSVERLGPTGRRVMVEELESLGGLANARALNRGDVAQGVPGDSEKLWVINVRRREQARADLAFEDIRLLAGDEVRLVYVRDEDGDGLMEREEVLLGSSDEDVDSDDDGLSDYQEAKIGWDVTIAYQNDGRDDTVTYRVTSSPTLTDGDRDGLSDDQERAAGTDPNNPDTDDDGLGDRCESDPLDADLTVDNFACRPEPIAAYVTRESGRSVTVLDVARDGSLAERMGSPVTGGGSNTTEVAVSADGRYVYVAGGRNGSPPVHVFDADPRTGDLTLNPFPQLTAGGGLKEWETVAADPLGEYVFAADRGPDSQRAYSFAVDRGAQPGRLTIIDRVSDISTPEKVVVEPLGRFVYVKGGRDIGIYRINRDPASGPDLGELVLLEELRLPWSVRDMEVGPEGRYLYAIGGSSNLGAVVEAWSIDPDTGRLTKVPGDFVPVANAQRIAVDPDRRFMWVISFDDMVFTYRITPNTGTLGLIDADGDPINGNTGFVVEDAHDLAVDPSGRQLFVVARGATHTLDIGPEGLLTETLTPAPVGGDYITLYNRLP